MVKDSYYILSHSESDSSHHFNGKTTLPNPISVLLFSVSEMWMEERNSQFSYHPQPTIFFSRPNPANISQLLELNQFLLLTNERTQNSRFEILGVAVAYPSRQDRRTSEEEDGRFSSEKKVSQIFQMVGTREDGSFKCLLVFCVPISGFFLLRR